MVPVLYLLTEARPDPSDPWAVHLLWGIVILACGALALFATSLLVVGWTRFTGRERAKLVLLALLGWRTAQFGFPGALVPNPRMQSTGRTGRHPPLGRSAP
jgi:hypothetical protein